MKTTRKIFIAFLLNLLFSILECIGGIFTGSVAIISDAVHDMGDAVSIGFSYFMEKTGQKAPDSQYTYGYSRYSLVGSFVTTGILLCSSLFMIYHSVKRILFPLEIHYNGMIVFAVIGICVNLCAVFLTSSGKSWNQRSVNLHMLEDTLGWLAVLLGAVVMYFTNWQWIDPLLSMVVSIFILFHSCKYLREISSVFLEKTPNGLSITEITEQLNKLQGVLGVHHLHVWSLDGQSHIATLHVVTDSDMTEIKKMIRDVFGKYSIRHVTIETETSLVHCQETECCISMHTHASLIPCHTHGRS